ncbi:MAG: FG-GAP repeat protein [Planctomycetaceae bacterium]|nr:FG-GAP repeat protein [Planctomycetaceae bacterium]
MVDLAHSSRRGEAGKSSSTSRALRVAVPTLDSGETPAVVQDADGDGFPDVVAGAAGERARRSAGSRARGPASP